MLDKSVQAVFADCARDETCNTLFPRHAQELNALLAQLREEPQQITIINPVSGELQELHLSRLAVQAILVMSGLNEMLSRGIELTVLCAEDYPFIDFTADYQDTLMGNLMLQIIELQCKV